MPRDTKVNIISAIHFTGEDVNDCLQCIDIYKEQGPDLLSTKVLKEAGSPIVPSPFRLFKLSPNQCLHQLVTFCMLNMNM